MYHIQMNLNKYTDVTYVIFLLYIEVEMLRYFQ